eukprot:5956723-Amphidinium_carterae.4
MRRGCIVRYSRPRAEAISWRDYLSPQTIGRLHPSWQLQKQWNQLTPSESRTPLRAGGSVEFLRRTRDSAGLQDQGRWASRKSMFHYTQLSLAAVSVRNIPVVQREKISILPLPEWPALCSTLFSGRDMPSHPALRWNSFSGTTPVKMNVRQVGASDP